jgi:Bacterial cadherin-like domain
VSGSVEVFAYSGTLKVEGSLTGDVGPLGAYSGATLELSNGTSHEVSLVGPSANLTLDSPASFTGSIQEIVAGDIIDLVGIKASSATYNGSTLTVDETNGQQLIYNVSGSLAGDIVKVASDNKGGTDVYWMLTPPVDNPDRTHVQAGATVTASAPGVLANDSDPIQGDHLFVSAVGGQAANVGHALAGDYGSLTLNADGSFIYTETGSLPASGVGLDVFSYTDSTGQGGTASSTLTVVATAASAGSYTAVPAGGAAGAANGRSAVLDGGAGSATLTAGTGKADVLIGGPGDTLNGASSGKDTFAFAGDFGQNTINNYMGTTKSSYDVIQLPRSDFGTDVAALLHDAKQVGGNTVITDPHNSADTITLTGIQLTSLHFDAHHFLLA